MTVAELIKQLQELPQDMKVAVNCQMSEDQDMASRAKVYSLEDAPYAKGDNVWGLRNYPDDEQIVFIE